MKALRAALEELQVEKELQNIGDTIAGLNELAAYAENNSTEIDAVSMESIFLSFREKDYNAIGNIENYRVAMEEMSAGVWAMLIAIAAAIAVAIKKFITWAFDGSSSSGGGGGGGHIGLVSSKVEETAKVVKEQSSKVEELNDELHKANVETAPDDKHPEATRKRINGIDDLADVYSKADAEHHQGFKFMKHPDPIAVDILENGPYSKAIQELINKMSGSGSDFYSQVAKTITDKLKTEPEKINEEYLREFNDSVEKDNKISLLYLKADTVPDAASALKELHAKVLASTPNKTYTLSELHKKMEVLMEEDITQLTRVVGEIANHLKTLQTASEDLSAQAAVLKHQTEVASREQDPRAESARIASVIMRRMGQLAKGACEITRHCSIFMQAMLSVASHIRSLGRLSLDMLNKYVLPKVTNEDSRKRISELGDQIRVSYAKYQL